MQLWLHEAMRPKRGHEPIPTNVARQVLFARIRQQRVRLAVPLIRAGSSLRGRLGQLDGQLDGLAERIERLPDRVLLYADDGEAAEFIIDAKSYLRAVLTPAEMKALADQVGRGTNVPGGAGGSIGVVVPLHTGASHERPRRPLPRP